MRFHLISFRSSYGHYHKLPEALFRGWIIGTNLEGT